MTGRARRGGKQGGRRAAHALDPRLPDADRVLGALDVLSAEAPVDVTAADLRRDLLCVTYRLLFAELAEAAGVPVPTTTALSGLATSFAGHGEAWQGRLVEARRCLEVDPAWVEVDVVGLGRLHEELFAWQPVLEDARWAWRREGRLRKAAGAYFTPAPLVGHLLDQTLQPALHRVVDGSADGVRLVDPACGAGAFLVPAARRVSRALEGRDVPSNEAWRRAVASMYGVDVDAAVLELARVCLWLEPLTRDPAGERPRAVEDLVVEAPLVRADAVADHWRAGSEFDVVVGNPPFANQLERLTARDATASRLLRSSGAEHVAAYTDLSAVFLLRALSWVVPGGRIGLVQPQSVLSVRDAAPVRRGVTGAGALRSVWSAESGVFDASVPTCALVVEVGAEQDVVQRWAGAEVVRGPDFLVGADGLGEEWGRLLAARLGIPEITLRGGGVLADLADCTADFRDQYYGLEPYVLEAPSSPPGEHLVPLVTSGLIDPAACHWGSRGTRFLKRAWHAPVVDTAALGEHPKLGPWARRRLVPKVLVGTQGKVLEAVADPQGRLLPSVPVLSVAPRDPADVWLVLAVLLAPPVCAHAAARYAGSALNPSAVKLSAKQASALPLPTDRAAWEAGAMEVREAQEAASSDERRGHLMSAGRHLCTAYDVTGAEADEVLSWWTARLP